MTVKTFTASVAASADDAVETLATQAVTLTGQDLNPVATTIIGFRFRGLTITPGAPILSASIQFSSNSNASGANNATIWCQATADAPAFSTASGNLSNQATRPRTAASVAWAIPDWLDGQRGTGQLTPDLTTIVSEWNALSGRAVGDDIVFLIQGGPSNRQFVAWDHASRQEATLTIEWERLFTSNVVTTIPVDGSPAVKSEFRANWTAIKNENLALQGAIVNLENAIAASTTETDVERFRGANSDTAAGNAAMFQAAIDAVNAGGGGTVSYARNYVSGMFVVKTGVTLRGAHFELDFRGQTGANTLQISGDHIIRLQLIGASTEEDVILTMRPKPRAAMPSITAVISSIGVTMFWTTPAMIFSRSSSRKPRRGGPPLLLTRMSGSGQAASSSACTSGRLTSPITGVTETPNRSAMSDAVRSSAAASRPLSTRSTPFSASAMAQPRPSPRLDAQTIAFRPAIPRSRIRPLFAFPDYPDRAAGSSVEIGLRSHRRCCDR